VRTLDPGEGEGTGTDLGHEHPVELALAVAEPAGEAGHALPVHDPVGHEPHGARHHVRPASTPETRGSRPAGSGDRRGSRPATAAAAVGWKRTCSRLGVRAGQLGRQ
jgi:hypothetical protein